MEKRKNRPWSKPLLTIGAVAALAFSASARAESALDGFLHAHYLDTLALIPAVTLLALLAFIVHVDLYHLRQQKADAGHQRRRP